MPPIFIAIAAAVGSLGLSAAASVALINTILFFGASLVLHGISKLFQIAQGTSSLKSQLASRTVTSRQAIAPWRAMYGANRAGGIITFLHTTGTRNEKLHIVATLTAPEVNPIPPIYFA